MKKVLVHGVREESVSTLSPCRNPSSSSAINIGVPDRILGAVVAELGLYGFWHVKGGFAELLRILERVAAVGSMAARSDPGLGDAGCREWLSGVVEWVRREGAGVSGAR